ncbi:MAG: Nif11-like leader peptide family natural product precursor [Candidatus Eremiobacterota bacterium]
MSLESAKLFIERMKTDEDFATGVTKCKDSGARKKFILEEGFDFTVDELSQAQGNELVEELSDEQVEAIAGGVWRCGLGDYACANAAPGQYN